MKKPGALDVAAGKSLGNQMRLVARVELVAEVFDVALHRPRCDPKLLGALFG